MRRLIAFNNVSVDGYFATPDGDLNWTTPDPDIQATAAGPVDPQSNFTILFGRKTYDQFESFWPNVVTDSATAPDPHHDVPESPEFRAIAEKINNATKIVFSKNRKDVTWKNSRLVRDIDPKEIKRLKEQPGEDMMIFGSGSVASQLTEHALIDEYQFVVNPIILGAGQLLIRDSSQLKLKLIEAKGLKSGNVMLRYEPAADT
jgi:dihydrofolate reductase